MKFTSQNFSKDEIEVLKELFINSLSANRGASYGQPIFKTFAPGEASFIRFLRKKGVNEETRNIIEKELGKELLDHDLSGKPLAPGNAEPLYARLEAQQKLLNSNNLPGMLEHLKDFNMSIKGSNYFSKNPKALEKAIEDERKSLEIAPPHMQDALKKQIDWMGAKKSTEDRIKLLQENIAKKNADEIADRKKEYDEYSKAEVTAGRKPKPRNEYDIESTINKYALDRIAKQKDLSNHPLFTGLTEKKARLEAYNKINPLNKIGENLTSLTTDLGTLKNRSPYFDGVKDTIGEFSDPKNINKDTEENFKFKKHHLSKVMEEFNEEAPVSRYKYLKGLDRPGDVREHGHRNLMNDQFNLKLNRDKNKLLEKGYKDLYEQSRREALENADRRSNNYKDLSKLDIDVHNHKFDTRKNVQNLQENAQKNLMEDLSAREKLEESLTKAKQIEANKPLYNQELQEKREMGLMNFMRGNQEEGKKKKARDDIMVQYSGHARGGVVESVYDQVVDYARAHFGDGGLVDRSMINAQENNLSPLQSLKNVSRFDQLNKRVAKAHGGPIERGAEKASRYSGIKERINQLREPIDTSMPLADIVTNIYAAYRGSSPHHQGGLQAMRSMMEQKAAARKAAEDRLNSAVTLEGELIGLENKERELDSAEKLENRKINILEKTLDLKKLKYGSGAGSEMFKDPLTGEVIPKHTGKMTAADMKNLQEAYAKIEHANSMEESINEMERLLPELNAGNPLAVVANALIPHSLGRDQAVDFLSGNQEKAQAFRGYGQDLVLGKHGGMKNIPKAESFVARIDSTKPNVALSAAANDSRYAAIRREAKVLRDSGFTTLKAYGAVPAVTVKDFGISESSLPTSTKQNNSASTADEAKYKRYLELKAKAVG